MTGALERQKAHAARAIRVDIGKVSLLLCSRPDDGQTVLARDGDVRWRRLSVRSPLRGSSSAGPLLCCGSALSTGALVQDGQPMGVYYPLAARPF